MRLQSTSSSKGSTGGQLLLADCDPSDAVGAAVYISGPVVGLKYQVRSTNIDNPSMVPAIGLLIRKTSPTECIVQTSGVLHDIYTGLTPRKHVMLGEGAGAPLTQTVPPRPTSGRRYFQFMGVALSDNIINIDVHPPVVRIPD